jgi:hypothetical protein
VRAGFGHWTSSSAGFPAQVTDVLSGLYIGCVLNTVNGRRCD